ncbi:MAG: AmmeMemoRadiSam system protein A [Spirochaetaceae bacterium]|jgi:AmmeMemoRadiSam system protein A|nr:AmmeMemoRadiSam system protein A [Spirochaetaceae bacterium]
MLSLTAAEKKILLASAREALVAAIFHDSQPRKVKHEVPAAASGLLYGLPCGVFVSLHTKNGALRGCIGSLIPDKPLYIMVRRMACAAAFEDPRFPPLTPGELDVCRIEISVLSPMEQCESPNAIEPGIHGVYLTYHGRSGVFLPQVPIEQGWSRVEYLDNLCLKAGVPPKSYKADDARLWTFTACVFGEEF